MELTKELEEQIIPLNIKIIEQLERKKQNILEPSLLDQPVIWSVTVAAFQLMRRYLRKSRESSSLANDLENLHNKIREWSEKYSFAVNLHEYNWMLFFTKMDNEADLTRTIDFLNSELERFQTLLFKLEPSYSPENVETIPSAPPRYAMLDASSFPEEDRIRLLKLDKIPKPFPLSQINPTMDLYYTRFRIVQKITDTHLSTKYCV